MPTFKLTLAYDGTRYAGWQIQPGRETVQGVVEAALSRITGEAIRISGSGRTDAGVHALGQVASFASQTALATETLLAALRAELPEDVSAIAMVPVPADFHARRDAVRKTYRYTIDDGPVPNLFRRHYCWHSRRRLDTTAMHRAAQALVGRHDFRSFQSRSPGRLSTVRTIHRATVDRGAEGDVNLIHCQFEGDGFLYNMVRAIVGTLVEVGRGAEPEAWPATVLAARDRAAAGMTAPAQGLFLVRVDYDGDPTTKSDDT